jgi:hypothetical protein
MKFKSNIEIQAGVEAGGSTGSNGQVLSSTGSGVAWIDQNAISAGNAEHVVVYAKNTHTASIAKGTPVYITGTVGATDTVEIAPADASDSAKMPAVGLLDETLAVNAFGYVVTGGFMDNIATDPIDGTTPSSNDTVYVKAGGGLTLTKPTGPTGLIQNVAKVGKVSGGNSGSLIVSSILRTNDVPNLTTGKIWVGDGNTVESTVVHLDEVNGRMGIGTNSPSEKLHVVGNGLFTGTLEVDTVDNGVGDFLTRTAGGVITRRTAAEVISDIGAGTVTSVATGGGLTGGPITTSGTISHADTSSQASVDNSNGIVIQDVTLDTYGHVTGLASVNLDGRYYTESEADSRFFNVAGDTVTGDAYFNATTLWRVSAVDAASQRADSRDDATNFSRLHWYGLTDTGGTSNFRHAWYDGTNYITVTANASGRIDFSGSAATMYIGSDRVFDDGYHPNADAWTTARTITIGNTGKSVSGSANVSWSLAEIGAQAALTNPITGTGTTNYLPKFTGSTALGNSLVYDNGTNVGIGTAGPTHKLQVVGDGAFNSTLGVQDPDVSSNGLLELQHDSTGSSIYSNPGSSNGSTVALRLGINYSEKMRIANNGNVGIGTTSPGTKLQVYNSTEGQYMEVGAGDGGGRSLVFTSSNNNGSAGALHTINAKSVSGAIALATAGSERMRITNTGNVGIGTTGPSQKTTILTSNESLHDVLGIYNGVTGTSALGKGAAIRIGNSTDGNYSTKIATIYEGNNPSYLQPALAFFTMNNTYLKGSEVERMRISANGNVGIGTTSPSEKLDVNGTFITRGASYFISGGVQISDNIYHYGDTNTYIGFPSADTFNIYTNGGNRLYINSSGNVGIGTTSPAALGGNIITLDIKGSSGGGIRSGVSGGSESAFYTIAAGGYLGTISNIPLYFQANNSVKATILANGNVGIGTTSPGSILHLVAESPTLKILSNQTYNSTTIEMGNGAGPTTGIISCFNNPGVSALELKYDNGATGDAKIRVGQQILDFQIDAVSAMYINSSRNVGIGTTSPSYKLDVTGTGNFAGNLQISTGDQATTRLLLKNTNSTGGRTFALVGGIHNVTQEGFSIYDTVAAATRFVILNTGNVGIGTTNPGYQLQLSTNSAAKPTSNVWTVVSDSRVKENIRTYDSGLDKVLQIEPKLFDYNGKAGFEKTKDNVGIIAQEIKKILPETVNTYKAKLNESDEEETELYSYDGHALTFALVNSIKELNKKIEQLETRIQTLENKQL